MQIVYCGVKPFKELKEFAENGSLFNIQQV